MKLLHDSGWVLGLVLLLQNEIQIIRRPLVVINQKKKKISALYKPSMRSTSAAHFSVSPCFFIIWCFSFCLFLFLFNFFVIVIIITMFVSAGIRRKWNLPQPRKYLSQIYITCPGHASFIHLTISCFPHCPRPLVNVLPVSWLSVLPGQVESILRVQSVGQ